MPPAIIDPGCCWWF